MNTSGGPLPRWGRPRKNFGIEVDWAVALAIVAQAADLATFLGVVAATGIGGESNPLVAWMWNIGGGAAVSVLKCGGVAAVLKFRGRWHVAVWILLLMGVAGTASNVVSWWLTWH